MEGGLVAVVWGVGSGLVRPGAVPCRVVSYREGNVNGKWYACMMSVTVVMMVDGDGTGQIARGQERDGAEEVAGGRW
jgi:hypothetical protein